MSRRTVCPNCGCSLKLGAVACPECGSDENTGWKDTATSEHPDISPFDELDYEDILHKEFGKQSKSHAATVKAVAVGLVIVILIALRLWGGF